MADINTMTWKEEGKMVKRASRAGATALQTAFNMTLQHVDNNRFEWSQSPERS